MAEGEDFFELNQMKEDGNVMKTGTTTVGMVCKGGIVLAADKRATSGYLIADKKTQKIYKLTDHIAVTIAGTASDAQLLVKLAKAELRLKRIRTGKDSAVKEAANLMARMVYNNIRKMSMIPGISHFIMGGKDASGFYLFDIFADGTISPVDNFISSGSGSVMAYGVLETLYKENMTVEEGIELSRKCVNAAIQRDIASGNGFDVVVITEEGARQVVSEEVENRIKL